MPSYLISGQGADPARRPLLVEGASPQAPPVFSAHSSVQSQLPVELTIDGDLVEGIATLGLATLARVPKPPPLIRAAQALSPSDPKPWKQAMVLQQVVTYGRLHWGEHKVDKLLQAAGAPETKKGRRALDTLELMKRGATAWKPWGDAVFLAAGVARTAPNPTAMKALIRIALGDRAFTLPIWEQKPFLVAMRGVLDFLEESKLHAMGFFHEFTASAAKPVKHLPLDAHTPVETAHSSRRNLDAPPFPAAVVQEDLAPDTAHVQTGYAPSLEIGLDPELDASLQEVVPAVLDGPTLPGVAANSLPALAALARSNSWQVRRSVAESLGSLGPEALPVLASLAKDAGKYWARVRTEVVKSLRKQGLDGASLLADMALTDPLPSIRSFALDVLAGLGATDALRSIAQEGDSAESEWARDWLRMAGHQVPGEAWGRARLGVQAPVPPSAPMVAMACELLVGALPGLAEHSLRAVPTQGRANPVMGFLDDRTTDPDRRVRRLAVESLAPMGTGVLRLLEGRVRDEDNLVRLATAQALAGKGPLAIPLLGALVRDEHRDVRQAAALSVAKSGPSPVALSALGVMAADETAMVRAAAARGLGLVGTGALEALSTLAKDLEWTVRLAAADSLGELGDQAAPILRVLAQDEHQLVKTTAEMALERAGEKT